MPDVKLYQGDCLEILPTLPKADVLLTDPPYGTKTKFGDAGLRYGGRVKHVDELIIGDDEPFDPEPFLHYPRIILFGANNYANKLPTSRGWIFWDKRPGMKKNDFGDGELIWTNKDTTIKRIVHMWNGVLRDSETGQEVLHPTQKPIALMKWIIENYTQPGDLILDPYMGSGPIGIAAVQLQRSYIGIEILHKYFDIAKKRIKEAQQQTIMDFAYA